MAIVPGSLLNLCRVLLALLTLGCDTIIAATPAEEQAYKAATQAFRDGFWNRADSELAAFTRTYTNSEFVGEAVLFQAEARFQMTNYPGTIELLTTRQSQAGKLADEYLYWLAEAWFEKGDYPAAADAFGKLTAGFPNSPRRLEARVREAQVWSNLSDWRRVVDLLQQMESQFQVASNNPPEPIVRGRLLLAEAHLALQNCRAAEQVLAPLANVKLEPRSDWERQYILCRVLVMDERVEDALAASTNLPVLALATGQKSAQVDTALFQAGLLESVGRANEAVAAYQQVLVEAASPKAQRQALMKISELSLWQNKPGEAADTLDKFMQKFPDAPSADLALLTVGELRLRQYAGQPSADQPPGALVHTTDCTNCLAQAFAALQTFPTRFPKSALLGKAELALGWCYWFSNNLAASESHFKAAVEHLTEPRLKATATFKLADAYFQQTNYSAAITTYGTVGEKFVGVAEVSSNLLETALYQTVRAGLAGGDVAAATNALARLLADYPQGTQAQSAVLLTSQELGPREPARARQILTDFLTAAPQAPMRPEVELALARTYELEEQWPSAIDLYDLWLGVNTNHVARPRAEVCRALANFRAGRETNALACFTNFLAQYPSNEFATFSQWWVADYFFNTGNNVEAMKSFDALFRMTPPSELTWRAGLMAGQAAVKWQGWNNAKDYFLRVYNDTNCPAELRAQGLFALGDWWMGRASTNKLADYEEAFKVFNLVGETFPSNRLAVLAVGKRASCLLQLAQLSRDYGPVTNAFQQVIASPMADAAARSIANVGLGVALENLAQDKSPTEKTVVLTQALNCYLDVLYGKCLHDGESPDLFWTKEAGLKGARLVEALQQWPQAINIYRRLQDLLPPLRSKLDEKIGKAQEQLDRGKS